MPSPRLASIALIGAGPRGASLLERIGANLGADLDVPEGARRDRPLEIHVIDDAQSGAGRIWRTDQTRELCMNTLADAVTLFTEPTGTFEGPVAPGPTLYEWCVLVLARALPAEAHDERVTGIPAAHIAAFAEHPTREHLAEDYRAELASLRPESHPSRALYGEYLAWFYDRAVAALPADVRVIRHRTRAVSIAHESGGERIRLADGSDLLADAVIAATGWLEREFTPHERELSAALAERPDLVWVRPESPVDQDLDGVGAGVHAIVRGLGMGFFDTMALLTVGRGGEFAPDAQAPGGLRYIPSGREPVLHVTSRRGVPFRSKTLYGSLPPSPEQRLLRGVDWNSAPRPIDFDRELWPRIVADAAIDHYTTLHRVRPQAFTAPLAKVERAVRDALDALLEPDARLELTGRLAASQHEHGEAGRSAGAVLGGAEPDARAWLFAVPRVLDEVVQSAVPDAADRFDLIAEMEPASQHFTGPEQFDAWVRDWVGADLAEAELGRDSARKAGLWSISSARGFVGRLGSFGAFDAESRASGFAVLHAVGGMAGSGPPAFRNRQLLALIDAGIVTFIGPEARVEVHPEGFTARSPRVAGSEVVAPVLIDAWMHFHDVAESADPLIASLARAGRVRAFQVRARDGGQAATGGLDIDAATGRLIGASGRLDPAVHFAGIPVDETVHDTIISPMPGTDPTMLRETDRVARSALRIAAASVSSAPQAQPSSAYDLTGACS